MHGTALSSGRLDMRWFFVMMSSNRPSFLCMNQDIPLGQQVSYADQYDANLLCFLPRAAARQQQEASVPLFCGVDLWRCFEVSWLNGQGMPQMAMGLFEVPCDSTHLVESKSLKLYLNSFNQTSFANQEQVASTISRDLSAGMGCAVQWQWWSQRHLPAELPGVSLDELDVEVNEYTVNADLLCASAGVDKQQRFYTHCFKSNCLVTAQPDWATVCVDLVGPPVDQASLLRYLMSYRHHQGFHEHCVEQIWLNLWMRLHPQELTVVAYFTRRGGIDINPLRTSEKQYEHPRWFLARQ
jgi:7-cyano-7-deazaguanine reductase